MKFRVTFKTLNRIEVVEYRREELTNSDLEKYAEHMAKLVGEGVVSSTFQLPAYGRVTFEVI